MCGEGAHSALISRIWCGSPPRVWGRLSRQRAAVGGIRFTPTCVGKAQTDPLAVFGPLVHPHVCGEGDSSSWKTAQLSGSPPRVWGRLVDLQIGPRRHRFTPTCVGKATVAAVPCTSVNGSPPRVWGRRVEQLVSRSRRRFTPTCVGKAQRGCPSRSRGSVHPHVCGEGVILGSSLMSDSGSPPRVWGRRAGETSHHPAPTVHPHVCGEGGPRIRSRRP